METITDVDYEDDLVLRTNTHFLLHNLEKSVKGFGLYMNLVKTEFMCFNQDTTISTQYDKSLKLVERFVYFGCNITSAESDISVCISKA